MTTILTAKEQNEINNTIVEVLKTSMIFGVVINRAVQLAVNEVEVHTVTDNYIGLPVGPDWRSYKVAIKNRGDVFIAVHDDATDCIFSNESILKAYVPEASMRNDFIAKVCHCCNLHIDESQYGFYLDGIHDSEVCIGLYRKDVGKRNLEMGFTFPLDQHKKVSIQQQVEMILADVNCLA